MLKELLELSPSVPILKSKFSNFFKSSLVLFKNLFETAQWLIMALSSFIFAKSSSLASTQWVNDKFLIPLNKFKNSNTAAGTTDRPLKNYLFINGNFGKLKITANEFENTGILHSNGTASNLSINFNDFSLNYSLTQNLTQNIIDIFVDSSYDSYKQYVITGNSVKSTQNNSSYVSTINFIKSYASFLYGQIYNNTFMKGTYSNFGTWLDAGTNLTTGTIIANNTNN